MQFNSGVFLIFLALFLAAYYMVRNRLRLRNLLIVAASYVFYGWWDVRFLSLIIISTALDYYAGLGIAKARHADGRKAWLFASLAGNLLILGFFKYFNFFAESLSDLLLEVGIPFQPFTLRIVLPVGISFYTFQTMSYTLDVYRGAIQPTREPINFMAYVSFFPQLVAGPIERASQLLPQFEQTRTITRNMVADGLWLFIWGMFKKVVLADNLAPLVSIAFDHPGMSGPVVFLGTLAFAAQIYCDFSGYSDIARGVAKWLGFELMVNFNLPYLSVNLREFWRRWHISLSTWLRDYLYVGLGGNRGGTARTYFNLLVTMLLGGLWHGAAWHFLLWGFWHGAGLTIQRFFTGNRPLQKRTGGVIGWLATFLFVLYGWLLFRAQSLEQIGALTLAFQDLTLPAWIGDYIVRLAVFTLPLALIQTWQARTKDLMAPARCGAWGNALLQGGMLIGIVLYWKTAMSPFIYFQF